MVPFRTRAVLKMLTKDAYEDQEVSLQNKSEQFEADSSDINILTESTLT